jgi:hypothetical protein
VYKQFKEHKHENKEYRDKRSPQDTKDLQREVRKRT